MKHLQFLLFFVFSVVCTGVKAQQNHFIYIQTENKQPFYVKLDNKLHSSTATGYLVLSKLKNGTYNLAIGFPKSEWPEQNLSCTIGNRDLGFVLKNFGEKGWGLFNLQTLEVVMANERKKTNVVAVETKTDEFSNLLSNVVNDPTIKQVEKMKEPEAPVVASTSSNEVPTAQSTSKDVPPIIATVPAVVPDKPATSSVKRTLLNTSANGTEMVFLDQADGNADTIKVFIPAEHEKSSEALAQSIPEAKETADKSPGVETAVIIQTVSDTKKTTKENTPSIEYNPKKSDKPAEIKAQEQTDKKFIDLSMADSTVPKSISPSEPEARKPVETAPVTSKDENQPQIIMSGSPMINSDCKAIATDADFMKLRKKMVGEDSDDEMIGIAKKAFKAKCYMVDQIRNLSVLFLKDEAKYAFFDMAYPFVSDSHNYKDLQGQLTDPYYVNRFKVMIRQ